jgi:hypothetical protein
MCTIGTENDLDCQTADLAEGRKCIVCNINELGVCYFSCID